MIVKSWRSSFFNLTILASVMSKLGLIYNKFYLYLIIIDLFGLYYFQELYVCVN